MAKRNVKQFIMRIIDVILSPLTFLAAVWMRNLRQVGIYNMPLAKRILLYVGVFPIRDHFYEPLFNPKHLRFSLEKERDLPGIDLNIKQQLLLLADFHYADELVQFAVEKQKEGVFYYRNGSFGAMIIVWATADVAWMERS